MMSPNTTNSTKKRSDGSMWRARSDRCGRDHAVHSSPIKKLLYRPDPSTQELPQVSIGKATEDSHRHSFQRHTAPCATKRIKLASEVFTASRTLLNQGAWRHTRVRRSVFFIHVDTRSPTEWLPSTPLLSPESCLRSEVSLNLFFEQSCTRMLSKMPRNFTNRYMRKKQSQCRQDVDVYLTTPNPLVGLSRSRRSV